MSIQEERVPCHAEVNVLEQKTIYHTEKLWLAVVLGQLKGRKFLAVYQWQNRNGTWKQKHKLKLNRKGDWLEIKPVIDDMIQRL